KCKKRREDYISMVLGGEAGPKGRDRQRDDHQRSSLGHRNRIVDRQRISRGYICRGCTEFPLQTLARLIQSLEAAIQPPFEAIVHLTIKAVLEIPGWIANTRRAGSSKRGIARQLARN